MIRSLLLSLLIVLAFTPTLWAQQGSTIRIIRRSDADKATDPQKTDKVRPSKKPQTEAERPTPPSSRRPQKPNPIPEVQRPTDEPLPRAMLPPASVSVDPARTTKGPRVVPWVALGTSVVLGVLGVVFAVEAGNALEEQNLELDIEGDTAELSDAFRDTQGAVVTNTIAATALLSAGAAGTIVSLLFLLDED